MSEHIRSIRLRIQIDTNKQTRTLDQYVELDEIESAVRDFVSEWKP